MRTIRQPGPVAAERAVAVPCRIEPVELHLKAGLTVNDAIAQAHGMQGFSGYLDLSGVPLAPLDYVIPGAAPDADHVAWYSQTHTLDAATIERAGAIVGIRDGEPFLHCHGEWAGRMGHLLPLDSIVASDCVVTGLKMDGARFEVGDNSETNFRLFAPKRAETTSKPDGFALVLRPNEPVLAAIEAVCARNSVRTSPNFRGRKHGRGPVRGRPGGRVLRDRTPRHRRSVSGWTLRTRRRHRRSRRGGQPWPACPRCRRSDHFRTGDPELLKISAGTLTGALRLVRRSRHGACQSGTTVPGNEAIFPISRLGQRNGRRASRPVRAMPVPPIAAPARGTTKGSGCTRYD